MTEIEFLTTPGHFYAAAYWLSALLVIVTNPKRIHGAKMYVAHAGSFLLLMSFMIATDGISKILFLPCILLDIAIIMFYILVSCDFSIYNAAYYGARAFITGEFIASLGWQLYYYGTRRGKLGFGTSTQVIFLLICYPILFLLLLFLEKRLFSKSNERTQEIEVNGRELITVSVITLMVFAISNMSYAFQNTPFSTSFNAEIYIIRTFVDLSGMVMLYAHHMQIQELQMQFEVDTLQNVLQMQYKSYQLSLESIEIVNRKYHDLKHQLALLKEEAVSQKSIDYLNQMEQEIKIYEAQNRTKNKVLDAVLTSKSLYCQSKGINLTCVADGTALEFMDDMDICALFGNILDNAIESVETLEDPDKRLIHLTVSNQKNFLRIHAENYCEQQLTFENNLPVTSKEDKRFHGFGVKSIQSTARKYGGSVTASEKNNWFELGILIPILK